MPTPPQELGDTTGAAWMTRFALGFFGGGLPIFVCVMFSNGFIEAVAAGLFAGCVLGGICAIFSKRFFTLLMGLFFNFPG